MSTAALEHILVHFSVQIIIHNCFTSESGSLHKWTAKARELRLQHFCIYLSFISHTVHMCSGYPHHTTLHENWKRMRPDKTFSLTIWHLRPPPPPRI